MGGTKQNILVTVSTPNLYPPAVTHGGGSCLGRGTRLSQAFYSGPWLQARVRALWLLVCSQMCLGTLDTEKFLNMTQGPVSPGVTRSVCRRSVATAVGPRQSQIGSGTAPMAFWAPMAGTPVAHEQASRGGGGRAGCSQAFVANRSESVQISPGQCGLQHRSGQCRSMWATSVLCPQSPHPVINNPMLPARSL